MFKQNLKFKGSAIQMNIFTKSSKQRELQGPKEEVCLVYGSIDKEAGVSLKCTER
jgi:hypothetical protein